MNYDLKRPCSDCPFLREGGIRLTPNRVHRIAGMMLSTGGGTFICHKTMETKSEQHCAGALIFAEKNRTATQAMRWMERIGVYDHTKLESQDSVFDTLPEMLESAI